MLTKANSPVRRIICSTSEVLPLAVENQDLVVKSQTGSGKTAFFGIPICDMIEWDDKKPQALILTPTREHNNQRKKAKSLKPQQGRLFKL